MEWPASFHEMCTGKRCPMCLQGRPDETASGVRIFAGEVSDAYLQRADIQRGYTIAVWRGRHVAEPTELSDEEAKQYWSELLWVASALERYLQTVKMNYKILGNSVPHLHTHVIPRFRDDPRPGGHFHFQTPSRIRSTWRRLRRTLPACARRWPGRSGWRLEPVPQGRRCVPAALPS
jgi:diadenosine tetraphosphate (Ap4A) HIT family hydrolase